MKAYIITEKEFEELFDKLKLENFERNRTISADDQIVYNEAHRFYNYIIRVWLEKMK